MSEPSITVVGAGIAGLTAAAALAQQGNSCTVYEQARRFDGTGAGVQLSPNATHLLRGLGLGDHLDRVAVRPRAIEWRRWRTGAPIARLELGAACERRYGAAYYTVHRADLHRGLLDLVAAAEPVRMRRRCVGVREGHHAVEVHWADGAEVTGDLAVGADGVGSMVRSGVAPGPRARAVSAVYRALVPAESAPGFVADPRIVIWLGPGRHCVCYPVSAGRWVNVVATVPAGWVGAATDVAPASVEELLAAYAGWHDELVALLAAVGPVTRWALTDRQTPDRWCSARTALVGDAAHPMLPFAAQGANQAVEDGVVLAACLRGVTAAEVPAALRRFERLRRPRVARIVAEARARGHDLHLPDGERQLARDRAMAEHRGMADSDWLFGYDALAAATEGVRHE
jgi:salicylate hydroxylase